MTTSTLLLTYKSKSYNIAIDSEHISLAKLACLIEDATGVRECAIKLLVPGRKAISLNEQPERRLQETGLLPGAKAMMLATSQAAVQQVQAAKEQARLPGFDHELRQAAARRGRNRAGPSEPPKGDWTFADYGVWTLPSLYPSPAEAIKLLHSLAADPGIVHVMAKHQWRVGMLSELPPQGKVGISPRCILGLNVNMGQEIKLRLRTDDMKGFRKYESIRETLIHELTHMVYGDHDNAFKGLNSQLKREVLAATSGTGRTLGYLSPVSVAASEVVGTGHWSMLGDEDGREQDSVMEATARLSGRTLAQLTAAGQGRDAAVATTMKPLTGLPPRLAAAEAALQRSAAARAAAAAGAEAGPVTIAESQDGMGEHVGDANEDIVTHFRALEHQDVATEQAEEAVRQMESVGSVPGA